MHRSNFNILVTLFLLFVTIYSCEEDVIPAEYPRVHTLDVVDIGPSGATFIGEVGSNHMDDITEYGFVYSEEVNPNLNGDRKVIQGSLSSKTFSSRITGALIKGKTYHVKAFAKTDQYTVYGVGVQFKSQGSEGPTVTRFEPEFGKVGDTLKIHGTNFSFRPLQNVVSLEDVQAKILKSSDTLITCLVPGGIEKRLVTVKVKVGDNESEAPGKFILDFPRIDELSPTNGTFLDTLYISGDYFSPEKGKNEVSLDGYACEVVYESVDSIRFVVPTDLTKKINKLLIISEGKVGTHESDFELLSPKINSIVPYQVRTGDEIVIEGENFCPDINNNRIEVLGSWKDGEQATILEAKKNYIRFVLPEYTYSTRRPKIELYVGEQSVSNYIELKDPWIAGRIAPGPDHLHLDNRLWPLTISGEKYSIFGLGMWQPASGSKRPYVDIHCLVGKSGPFWKELPTYPGEGASEATGFILNDILYVGMGSNNEESTNEWYSLDLPSYLAGSQTFWQKLGNFPGNPEKSISHVVNNKAYLVNSDNELWSYNQVEDIWVFENSLDMGNYFLGKFSGFTIDDKIYHCNFHLEDDARIYEIDTRSKTVTRNYILSYPENGKNPNFAATSAHEMNGKGILVGPGVTYEFDPALNSLRRLSDFKSSTWFTNAFKHGSTGNEFIYYGGGYSQILWQYDPRFEIE